MRTANLFLGSFGTLATIEASKLSTAAAIFAGSATGVWMLTQTVLAIAKAIKEKK